MAGETDDIDELLAMLVDDEAGTERAAPQVERTPDDGGQPRRPEPTSEPHAGRHDHPPAQQGYADTGYGPPAQAPAGPAGYQEIPYSQAHTGDAAGYAGAPATAASGSSVLSTGPASTRSSSPRRRGLLTFLLVSGAVNIVALILLVVWWTGRDSDTSSEVESANASTPTSVATSELADSSASTTGTTEPATPTTAPDGTMISVAPTAENPTGAIRYAVFDQGQIHLRGLIPSQELADMHVAGGELIMGPGSVISEYEIDPAAPVETDQFPVYIADVVLFGFNSVDLDPASYALLDTTPLFLQQNPNATVTVIARTDAVGSEEINLEISARRAQAVIDYWVEQGVDPSRVIADPRGEESASGNEDDEVAAQDRRVEFVLNNLLG